MLFSLIERERPFWRYKNVNNRIKKFYEGMARATEIGGIYYQEPLNEVNSSLTCIYKNSDQSFFSLAAAKKRVHEVNAYSITNDENWSGFYRNGLYVCGDDNQPKESIDSCQFSLKISR